MSDYCEIAISAEEGMHDILIAELAEIGYDGFEEFPGLLKAFIPEAHLGCDDDLMLHIYKGRVEICPDAHKIIYLYRFKIGFP